MNYLSITEKKYFCVSTDKAANPVNMMGASKRIMELFLFSDKNNLPVSMARFANVAFSDGSCYMVLMRELTRINQSQHLMMLKDILSPLKNQESYAWYQD